MRPLRREMTKNTRHHRPMHRLAVVFLLIVPSLYGSAYLWSNCDPYGRLSNFPVAVVTHDNVVTADGRDVAVGDQLLNNLFDDPVSGWELTDDERAATGLEDGGYYPTITISRSVSPDLASGAEGAPRRAMLDMRRNDAKDDIGIMTKTARMEPHDQINAASTKAYFESVYG